MLDLTSESYARERLAESPLRILREGSAGFSLTKVEGNPNDQPIETLSKEI